MSIRVDEETRDEFHAAARVKGTRAATLIHQYMVAYIKAVKKEDPEEFTEKLVIVLAEKEEEERKRLEKKQKKTEAASVRENDIVEVKGSANKPRFDVGPGQTHAPESETILIDDDVDFDRDYDKRDADGNRLDARGNPIIDLRIDKTYIPRADIIIIHPEDDENK
jgi:hypothetical protein